MMKTYLFVLTILLSLTTHAKLLDKVAGVVNDQIFTLSEIERIKNTIAIRKEIAPFIYKGESHANQDVLKILQNSYIIKDKLAELGFIIGDDAVESRISETQKNLNLSRADLVQFLSTKGISMIEYFELIRQAMEFSVYQRRIIGPLITITDQELKNFYYQLSKDDKVLSFRYKVIDYTLPVKGLSEANLKTLQQSFTKYRTTGVISPEYKDFDTTDMGTVSDEDLPKELSAILKKTDENSFSEAYIKNSVAHLFFISKKELAESTEFLRVKQQLYGKLFEERSKKISDNWLSRESLNYYTLNKL